MLSNKRTITTLAILAIVIGMVISILAAAINAMPDDEPLSTRAAVAVPSQYHSTPEPVPDSRKDFRTDPLPVIVSTPSPATSVTAPPSQNVIAAPVVPKPVVPPKIKPQRVSVPVAPPAALPSSAAEIAISFALAQVGKPYVWGATGPNAYDCSGLVMTAFRQAGIQLPRTTKTIISRGKPVSRTQLQRGDLVWPSSGHVGIYVGNGQFVHAPQPGERVKVSKLYAFYAGRRL